MMGLEHFMNEAISPWLKEEGPDSDIVMSSRIRLARNLDGVSFPLIANEKQLMPAMSTLSLTTAGA